MTIQESATKQAGFVSEALSLMLIAIFQNNYDKAAVQCKVARSILQKLSKVLPKVRAPK